jgi:hypothetical protein
LVDPNALVADNTDCVTNADGTSTVCSIDSQMVAMASHMQPGVPPFAVVMMHPQDFGGDGVTGNATLVNAFYDTLLPLVKAKYDIFTISDMIKAANGQYVAPYCPMNATATYAPPCGNGQSSSSTSSSASSSSTPAKASSSTGASQTSASFSSSSLSASGIIHPSSSSSTGHFPSAASPAVQSSTIALLATMLLGAFIVKSL